MENSFRNVRSYGAAGDGKTDDTAAVQRAIDAGGTVFFPAGNYRTGTLYLKSHGGLELAPDAKITASPDPADYNKADFCPQNWASKTEKASGAHLIVALECENVFIRGGGTIHGSREAFFDPEKTASRDDFTGWRPSQMLWFCECRNVTVQDVTLINSPYWSCFFFGCCDVIVRGVRISNTPASSWNGDGISIDTCRNAAVSDCILRTGDDCITVRASDWQRLRNRKGFLTPVKNYFRQESCGASPDEKDPPCICENVVISNCVLQDGHCGVRFGVGTGLIRNCSVTGLAIRNCWYGIGIHSSYLPEKGEVNGVSVENILISGLAVDGGSPFYISANGSGGPLPGSNGKYIRHISLSGIRAKGFWNVLIQGNMDRNISDVELNNVHLVFSNGVQILPEPQEKRKDWMCFRYPCGIFAANVSDFRFSHVSVRWENADPKWRSAVLLRNSGDAVFHDCSFHAPEGGTDVIQE